MRGRPASRSGIEPLFRPGVPGMPEDHRGDTLEVPREHRGEHCDDRGLPLVYLIVTLLMVTVCFGLPSPWPFESSSPAAAILVTTSMPEVTLPQGV